MGKLTGKENNIWFSLAINYGYGQHMGPFIMFSVHDPGKMFSVHERSDCEHCENVLGMYSFRFKISTHLGLRSMTYCVYTAQRVRSF